jgi:MarR family transcriptional regulator, organic hydroperoxide resistance regulator
MVKRFNFDLSLVFASINGKVSAAINRKLSRNLRQNNIPLTAEQWTIMDVLWKTESVSQNFLCETTSRDKPSMTRIIDNLVKIGLVNRKMNKENRRSNLISLTKKGKDIEEPTNIVIDKTLKEVFNGLTEEEMERGQRMLRRIFDNISE